MKIPLHDYQIFAKDFLLTHPYCGLFLQMGLGKTSIVLEALWELNPSCHVLVVAPKTIARCTWINEIAKWNIGLRTQSLLVNENGKGLSKKAREALLDVVPSAPPTVYFINRELVANIIKYYEEKSVIWPFRMVIIDESQSFKSYAAERFKAMKKARPWISRLILLTGSPAPKSLEDLWPQIWLLDMGERLGRTITDYRLRYFNPGLMVNGRPVNWQPKPNAEDEIYANISDLVISMKNKYIQLPPLTFNPVYADMMEDERKRYRDFVRTSVLDLSDGTQIEAANAAALSVKLSQMASGAIYKETGSHEFEIIHTHKLELCEYIINNTPGNVIIAYRFQSDREMLMNYLRQAGMNPVLFDGSPEMERAWNVRRIPVLLAQPAACGFGLNLQQGGSTLIWYTLPWSLEQYEQMNARIYRQGQTEPVMIHQLMTRGTIDTHILSALHEKDTNQQRLMSAIEATVKSAANED